MSETFRAVRLLVAADDFLISQHAARELLRRDIRLDDLVSSLDGAVVVEDYPDYWKGPTVLVLQEVSRKRSVHVLWGLELGSNRPAVLVTAYWPDVSRWSADFLRRRP